MSNRCQTSLDNFGNYRGYSGCHWCGIKADCVAETERKGGGNGEEEVHAAQATKVRKFLGDKGLRDVRRPVVQAEDS